MLREAELFADCLAHPDDDGPRLVWADHVGGERGEFVVLQCDIARGGLSDAEGAARKQRERELLENHAIEWAGDVAKHATRWSFRRGFVESVRVNSLDGLDAGALRSLAPIRAVTVKPISNNKIRPEQLEPLRGVTAFGMIDNPPLEQLDDIAPLLATFGLRALAMDNLTSGGLDAMLAIVRASPIEYLRLRHLRITPHQLDRLLAAAPALAALDLEPSPLSEPAPTTGIQQPLGRRAMIDVAVGHPLRALRLGPVTTDDVSPLLGSVAARTLERLGYEPLGEVRFASVLPALRVSAVPPPRELLHPSADALLDLGSPWFVSAPPFWIVRLDRVELFAIPAKPIDEDTLIGRSMDVEISIPTGTVGRRHARVSWLRDQHVVIDTGSTNGVLIDGERIARAHPLADGVTMTLGQAVIRYFVGPGAEQRARVLVAGVSGDG